MPVFIELIKYLPKFVGLIQRLMVYQNKFDQYLKELRELEEIFYEAQSKEILPLSFFSSSIDRLNRLRTGIFEIETAQLRMMQEHLKEPESEWYETNEPIESEKPAELKTIEDQSMEDKTVPVTNVLADTISRKINADFRKSLSLNDRFMFQRDLFQGNANEMNQAFTQLNEYQSLNEVLAFLSEKYAISWNSDSGIILKELLDKRFA